MLLPVRSPDPDVSALGENLTSVLRVVLEREAIQRG